MSYSKVWSGDWRRRVAERVRRRGFESVTQYAKAHLGVSLLELASELGPDDIAAAQIRAMLVDEAVRSDAVVYMLRDLLVRELRSALPQGWKRPLDEESRSQIAGAFSGWYAELQDHLDGDTVVSVAKELLRAELPEGWRPAGPDDSIIVAFVDRCLGRAPS